MNTLNRVILLVFISLFTSNFTTAQQLNHVLGDILVKPTDNSQMIELRRQLQFFEGKPTQLKAKKLIAKPMEVWLFQFDYTTINEYHFLNYIARHTAVDLAQFNHISELRATIPDDTNFPQQWQYLNDGMNGNVVDADLDADEAWDITRGGLTANGDTIVVCIIDDGLDSDHEDIQDNLWFNRAETPNNGMDDDNNGFVDDYQGWNTGTDSDNIGGGSHGTPVAAIVGAQGNNGMGVTGVNWDVQLMIVKGGTGIESEVLEAYSYPYIAREKYNETNGAEGAFVVATNASWGVDNAFPSDAPIWCSFYDSLGTVGILNVGATTNSNADVDVVGDLPTSCPSDFLITATNVNSSDVKVNAAGFGATTIDVGAFGTGTFTARVGDNYGTFGGTSSAAPHVAGLIGLIYSVPCPALASLASNDPQGAAALVRQYLLDGVDPNPTLIGITTTGGRINMFNSVNFAVTECSPCPPPSSITANSITDEQATLSWIEGDSTLSIDIRWRAIGTNTWTDVTNASSPLVLSGLQECTDYEYQLNANCSSITSGYTASFTFKTDGCCIAPPDFALDNLGGDFATFSWSALLAAASYNVRYRPVGMMTWTTIPYTNTSASFSNLMVCTDYEAQIQTVCTNGITTAFGPMINFTTAGCGPCVDFAYCPSNGEDSSTEWINNVLINTISNVSGNNNGYGDFTGTSTDLEIGETYPITLEPGFSGQPFYEHWKIWIDYNQDGDFEDADELAFDVGTSSLETVTGEITIPAAALEGLTRMRVTMKWTGANGGSLPPTECEANFGFGEVEDYCVNIINTISSTCTEVPSNLLVNDISSNSAMATWNATADATEYVFRYKEQTVNTWMTNNTTDLTYMMNDLAADTDYEMQVRAVCGTEMSNYSASVFFSTSPVGTANIIAGLGMSIQPNPFRDALQIELNLSSTMDISLSLMDLQGRILHTDNQSLSTGTHQLTWQELDNLSAGIYFLNIRTESVYINLYAYKSVFCPFFTWANRC